MTADDAPPADKIDVWRTVGAAYAFIFARPLRLLRLGGWWLALVALSQLRWLLPPSLTPTLLTGPTLGGAVVSLAFLLFYAAGFLSFCVALHRAVLSDESRSWFAALRFRRREWRFLGYILLIFVLMAVPVVFVNYLLASIGFAALQGGANAAAIFLAWFVIGYLEFLLVWIYGARLMLVLPAVAADETGDRLTRAWERSRGNAWRLYLGSILCTLPFAASSAIVPWLSDLKRSDPYDAISFLSSFLELCVLVAFYSYCYRQLATAAPAPDLSAPQAAPAE